MIYICGEQSWEQIGNRRNEMYARNRNWREEVAAFRKYVGGEQVGTLEVSANDEKLRGLYKAISGFMRARSHNIRGFNGNATIIKRVT